MAMPFSLARLAGATLMVAATTADDAIWLVPYTAPSLPTSTRVIHGSLFVLTLELLACGCVLVATCLQWAVDTNHDDNDAQPSSTSMIDEQIILGSIGAGICWIIALVLYVRKCLKRRRRAIKQAELHRAATQRASNQYGSIIEDAEDGNHNEQGDEGSSLDVGDKDEAGKVSSQPSPWAVISFTTIGALDEVSYFPSLLLGKIFTPLDLCVGTLFASFIVLIVVTLFLSQCNPLLQWLDRIPLYGIVSVFAVVLTAGVIIDVCQ